MRSDLRRLGRIEAPSPLPAGLSTTEVETLVRDSIKRDGDEPPTVVREVREAVKEAGFGVEDWLSTSVVSGQFECQRDGVVVDVYVTWNVPHRRWFVIVAPAGLRARFRRRSAEQAVQALCDAIDAKLDISADGRQVEWFTEEQWEEVERLSPGDRVEWIGKPYVEETPAGEEVVAVRPGQVGEVVDVEPSGIVRRLTERLGGPESTTVVVGFCDGVTLVARRSDLRRT